MARWDAGRLLRAAAVAFSERFLWGFATLAVGSLLFAVVPASLMEPSGEPVAGGLLAIVEPFSGASPWQAFASNLEFLKLKALQMLYDGKVVSVFAMFLLGASIGSSGIFRELERHRRLLRRVFFVAAPVGLVGNAILVPLHAATPVFPPTPLRALENAVFALAVPALALAYASGLSLLWLRAPARRWLGWLAPPGRMALTTYLSHTAVLMGLFYGWGLGWMFGIGQAECLLAAFLIFAVQCVASRLWLGVFRFGPVEWGWRCATYGRWLPLRRAPAAGA
jgi:uncharacterized protein